MKNFVTALQFLTVVTVNKRHKIQEGDLAKSMVFFPVVGFLIGYFFVVADKFFSLIALPPTVANLLLVALSVLVTRALHIDGLADTLDGIMGGTTAKTRLSIMKDSRIGTAGVLGIFFVLLAKYLCLNSIVGSEKVAALLITPMISRWSQTIMAFRGNYGRENGMARAFVGHLRTSNFVYASLLAVGFTVFVIMQEDLRAVFLIASVIIGVLVLTLSGRWFIVRKIGGVTGDTIGAVSELNEALVLLLFVVFSGAN